MVRAEELQLVLPDPLVLAGVVAKMSDALARLGGAGSSGCIPVVFGETAFGHRSPAGNARDPNVFGTSSSGS